jgi:hypothetical protein
MASVSKERPCTLRHATRGQVGRCAEGTPMCVDDRRLICGAVSPVQGTSSQPPSLKRGSLVSKN